MERRDECIELLKELKNCMEDYTGNKTVANNITLITNVSYDSAKFVIDQAISILENENPSEMGKTLIDASYERGLKDAWECAKKMFEMPYIELQNILQYCKESCKMSFYEKEFLINIDKDNYIESASEEEYPASYICR